MRLEVGRARIDAVFGTTPLETFVLVSGSGGFPEIESTEFALPAPALSVFMLCPTPGTIKCKLNVNHIELQASFTHSLPNSASAATMDLALARPTLRLVAGSRLGGEGTLGPADPAKE